MAQSADAVYSSLCTAACHTEQQMPLLIERYRLAEDPAIALQQFLAGHNVTDETMQRELAERLLQRADPAP